MNVALVGYGKMGKEIEKILLKKGHTVGLKTTSSTSHLLNTEALEKIDLAIEFSGPDTAYANVKLCIESGTPVICGSTGWLERLNDIEKRTIDNNTAFLYASNFSLGVNVLFALNEQLSRLLGKDLSYKISIDETHHQEKKDAPSGTAITLANQIIHNTDQRFTEWSLDQETGKLPIKAFREPNVPGTHVISYDSDQDIIELKHLAKNRTGFALGAVLAAEFIADKKGVFSMKDVLNV